MSSRTYLDHNATTPIRPAARDAAMAALDLVGNPSSVHADGRAARAVMDGARREVAALVGADPNDVFFTSGATEALNMALTPEFGSTSGAADVLLVGAGEHPAVLAGHRFPADKVEIIPTAPDGVIDLVALDLALERHAGRAVMLALQAANNETGVIQPVAEAARRVHARDGVVICDAVQAIGKVDMSLATLGADAIALSAHKFGGPKGVGALIFNGSTHHLSQGVVRGGGQERGLRSGTENVPGIAGLGAAARVVAEAGLTHLAAIERWRTRIETAIMGLLPEAEVFGSGAKRLPNTVCFAAPGLDAQVLLMNLDLAGVAVSTGSACSSGTVKPSHVLRAMNVPDELARSMVRVSLGWTTRDEDIAIFEAAFAKALRTMRAKATRRAA